MKRITLTIVAILLAVPVTAIAKTGIGFSRSPANIETGHKTKINIVLMHEPRRPGGQPTPMAEGKHPLVTFRSDSGRVIRIRGAAVSREGLSYATVAFPDKGPWHSAITVGHRNISTGESGQGFPIGTEVGGLPTPKTSARPAAAGFPWIWVVSIAAIA